MGTSSANPDKLTTYSTNALEMDANLRTEANNVATAVNALPSNRHLPSSGDVHQALRDLVGDWHHLDEFVGDVARGFRQADSGDGVVTVSDADIARLGQVGFADRDEAIAAAEAAQRELDVLLRQNVDELDRGRLEALFADIQRGQYDPAFTVTFSEAIGVEGYVDTMALIRNTYTSTDGVYHVTQQGLGYAALLGTTLNTALDTVYQDDEDYDDPDNAALDGPDRLDYGFIEDLTTNYSGEDYVGMGPNPEEEIAVRRQGGNPVDFERDLSVLISYTNPPDWVAVDIANHRLSPMLEMHQTDYFPGNSGPEAQIWGDRSGVITNYATMLSRNSDASTTWLASSGYNADGETVAHDNLRLVLERTTGTDIDGGAALAQVVENGLTNDSIQEPVPGGYPGSMGPMREELMDRAITYIGDMDEIRNEHMHDALATGVDRNFNVIDERINQDWQDGQGMNDRILDTHDFLREVMADETAMETVTNRLDEHMRDELVGLPDNEADRQRTLEENGRLLGVFTQAEANAILEAGEGEHAERLRNAGLVDSVAGLVPYVGNANSAADILFDSSAGDLLFPGDPDIDAAQARMVEIYNESRLSTWSYIAMESIDSGAVPPNEALNQAGVAPGSDGDFLTGNPGDTNRTVMDINDMSEAQREAFANYMTANDPDNGTFAYGTDARQDRNNLSAGLNDTALSDLMNRSEG
jgi:hypothetical protein